MASTQNYDIPLPQLGEPADIRVIDQGTEKIDNIMHGNRTMIAPGWVSTETYNTGNRVVYLGEYYKCKADNVTGAWDATKWDKTTVGEDIEGLGTGGASALSDLDDVEITSPTDRQALLYDDSDDTWKNSTLPDPSVVKEVTGNPVEFTDGADAPLVKCVSDITGFQDLHGYDKPWVGGAGKNKLPMTVSGIKALNTTGTWSGNAYTLNGITFTLETDNSGENVTGIKEVGTATTDFDFIIAESAFLNGDYKLSFESSSSVGGNLYSLFCKIGDATATYTTTNQSRNISATSTDVVKIRIAHGNGVVMDTVVKPMIRLSTVTDPTFEPYSNICPITAYTEGEIEVRGKNLVNDKSFTSGLPNTAIGSDINNIISSTRYCYYEFKSPKTNCIVSAKSNDAELFVGYIIFGYKNGVLTYYSGQRLPTEKYAVDMTDFDIVRVSIGAANGKTVPLDLTGYGYLQVEKGSTATPYEPYTSTTHTTTYPTSIYQGNADFVGSKATATWGYIASYNGETLPGEWISSMDEYAPGTTPTTGAQVAYELASPTEETITPTNLPIKSLFGYNHIESSTGDMVVDYIRDTYQPIVDLIQSSSHVYSTAEQVVGKWTDGKTVYEKTVVSEVSLTNSWQNYVYSSDMDTIISVEARCTRDGEEAQMAFSSSEVASWINRDSYIKVCTPTNSSDWKILSMTVRYTKTTANRSLSAPLSSQKAQIEPLSEKEEEVLTEEEKAVETPVEEKTEGENEEER